MSRKPRYTRRCLTPTRNGGCCVYRKEPGVRHTQAIAKFKTERGRDLRRVSCADQLRPHRSEFQGSKQTKEQTWMEVGGGEDHAADPGSRATTDVKTNFKPATPEDEKNQVDSSVQPTTKYKETKTHEEGVPQHTHHARNNIPEFKQPKTNKYQSKALHSPLHDTILTVDKIARATYLVRVKCNSLRRDRRRGGGQGTWRLRHPLAPNPKRLRLPGQQSPCHFQEGRVLAIAK